MKEKLSKLSPIAHHSFRTLDEEDCLKFNVTSGQIAESGVELLNVTRSVSFYDVLPTKLRISSYYYKIYCIGLNSVFASVIPLASLFYLNICTVIALRKMKLQLEIQPEAAAAGNNGNNPTLKQRVGTRSHVAVFYRNGSQKVRTRFNQSTSESRKSR